MKIMCVISGMKNGGAERVMASLVNYFSESNNVRLVILKEKESDYFISKKVNIKSGNIRNKNMFKSISFVKKNLEEYKPDIVLSFMTKNNIVSLLAKKMSKHKCKFIISERANPYYTKGILSFLRRCTYWLADGCVFQTKWAQDYYKNILRCKSEIIPNPLSKDFNIKPYDGEKEKKIVCTARLSPEKNQELLIRTFFELKDEIPDYRVEIYGEGPTREYLNTIIHDLNLEGCVFLKGRTKDIIEQIKNASIFVLPSNSEGMPNSLLEAQALGIPCIATDSPIGGSSIILGNQENGILIPMNDVNSLKNAIITLIKNKELAREYAKKGPINIKKYDYEYICQKWQDFLNRIYLSNSKENKK